MKSVFDARLYYRSDDIWAHLFSLKSSVLGEVSKIPFRQLFSAGGHFCPHSEHSLLAKFSEKSRIVLVWCFSKALINMHVKSQIVCCFRINQMWNVATAKMWQTSLVVLSHSLPCLRPNGPTKHDGAHPPLVRTFTRWNAPTFHTHRTHLPPTQI